MHTKSFVAVVTLIASLGMKAERTPVSPGQYYSGAGIGTFVGFGVGQAIQGRYKETGWIFTVSELSSIAVIASGLIWAAVATSKNYDANKEPHMYIPVGGLAMVITGSIMGGAFRIWDIIDLWAGAVPTESKKTSALNLRNQNETAHTKSTQNIVFDVVNFGF